MIRNLEHLFCVESLRDQGSAWRSGFSHRKEGISSLLINTQNAGVQRMVQRNGAPGSFQPRGQGAKQRRKNVTSHFHPSVRMSTVNAHKGRRAGRGQEGGGQAAR